MSDQIFDRLLDELQALDYAGILSFHRYNEPTLRKDLESLVERARQRIPHARLVLYSNGKRLTQTRIDRLLSAGVDQFIITDHARRGIRPGSGIVVFQPEDLVISGRAGWLVSVNEPLQLPCFAPAEMLIVGYNGDVYLCVQDYGREYVMGNIICQSLTDIWETPAFRRYRDLLSRGQRADACGLCSRCDGTEYTEARTE